MRVSKIHKQERTLLKESSTYLLSLGAFFFLVVHSIELVEFLKTWGLLSNKQCLENIAQVVKHTNFTFIGYVLPELFGKNRQLETII